jgi:hypothetical protein
MGPAVGLRADHVVGRDLGLRDRIAQCSSETS